MRSPGKAKTPGDLEKGQETPGPSAESLDEDEASGDGGATVEGEELKSKKGDLQEGKDQQVQETE